jgi:hypothetical protein
LPGENLTARSACPKLTGARVMEGLRTFWPERRVSGEGGEHEGMKLVPSLALSLGLLIGALWVRIGMPDCADASKGEGRYSEVCREALP